MRRQLAVELGEHGVLADHSDDIVMFDVPPSSDGVLGIDAYRETWPPFFTWQEQGASFEIVSLEVTEGDDYRTSAPCGYSQRGGPLRLRHGRP